jgi:hypothetical protein
MARQAGLLALLGALVATGIACSSTDISCSMVLTGAETSTQRCEFDALSRAQSEIFMTIGSRDSGSGNGPDFAFLFVTIDGKLSAGTISSPTATFRAVVQNGWGRWGDETAPVESYAGTATMTLTEVSAPTATTVIVHGSAEAMLPGDADAGTTGTVNMSVTF